MHNKYERWLAELKETGQDGTLHGGVVRLRAESYSEGYAERIKEFEQLKGELRATQRNLTKLKAKFKEFQKGWVVEFMKQTNGEQQ